MKIITIDRAVVEQALDILDSEFTSVDGEFCRWCDGRLTPARHSCKLEQAITALKAALAQEQAEPVQEQDIEDAIEAAYWHFDARRSGLNEWASAPQSERDAFKAEARKLVRGYFPTRQAQDTKREMLAVADAFIRGKRAAAEIGRSMK